MIPNWLKKLLGKNANIVETAVLDTVTTRAVEIISEQISKSVYPDFSKMSKKEIDEWAETHIGVTLDRRLTKDKMLEELKKHL